MKIKGNYILSEVGDETIAVPVGETGDHYHGIIKLNDTGRFIWESISDGKTNDQIATDMIKMYSGVTYNEALDNINKIVNRFREEGIIED